MPNTQTAPRRTDAEAWALVLENDGLVKMVVDRFCKRHPTSRRFEDYYSAGQIGAFKAAKNYDPERTRISTFLWSSIWWECDKAWKAEEAKAIGRVIKQEDGSRKFVKLVSYAIWDGSTGEYLDEPTARAVNEYEGFEEELVDRLFTDEQTELALEALSRLDERDQDVIEQHVMLGRPFRELAEGYGVTHETVRNRVNRALGRLRAEMELVDA